MILSDIDIHAAMEREWQPLVIDPPLPRRAFQPTSVDVTLGAGIKGWRLASGTPFEKWEPWEYDMGPEGACLNQGDFFLGTTEQRFQIPGDMCAQLSGKSSLARLGLQVHATAGFIDPGFRGQITLEMTNSSPMPFRLIPGMFVAQLIFTKLSCVPAFLYGSDEQLGSHYQDQVGTTRSYLDASN